VRVEQEDLHSKSVIENALKRTFSPEFLNRIDDVVIFNSLTKEHIFKIIDIMLTELRKRVTSLGYKLELTDTAKEFVAERGYDTKFGARPLQRAIQKYIEDPLAEELLNSEMKPNDTIVVELDEKDSEKLKTSVKKAVAEEKVDG
jgi:ATP-dependent Clp protease ATP-binding subunit ClpC